MYKYVYTQTQGRLRQSCVITIVLQIVVYITVVRHIRRTPLATEMMRHARHGTTSSCNGRDGAQFRLVALLLLLDKNYLILGSMRSVPRPSYVLGLSQLFVFILVHLLMCTIYAGGMRVNSVAVYENKY